jgi:hypothetical protein
MAWPSCDPVDLVGRWLVAWVLRAKHPVVDDDLGVLFVLGCGDELLFNRQAHEALGHHHEFVHGVLLDYVISRPDARMVSEVAALAMVLIKPSASID